MEWRLDFLAPDRFHVRQAAPAKVFGMPEDQPADQEMLFDEWVSIGTDHYQNMGLWVEVEDSDSIQGLCETNESLLATKPLDVLAKNDPLSAAAYSSGENHYLRLEYEPSALIGECNGSLDSQDAFSIWVDLDTDHLVKVEAATSHGRICQVFTGYEQALTVRPPKHLNAVWNADGQLTITDNRVEILPFFPEEY